LVVVAVSRLLPMNLLHMLAGLQPPQLLLLLLLLPLW